MGRTVGELLAALADDPLELDYWLAFYSLEPLGDQRNDYQAAILAYTVAASNWSGKGCSPKLRDYLKAFDFEPKQEHAEDEQIAMWKGWCEMVATKQRGG